MLRNKKPASEAVFCSRTCRYVFSSFLDSFIKVFIDSLDSIKKNGLDWVKDLGRKNMEDLLTIIQWNEDNVRNLINLRGCLLTEVF